MCEVELIERSDRIRVLAVAVEDLEADILLTKANGGESGIIVIVERCRLE